MVLGMSLATFTFLHVLISLVGIASGLIVLERFFRNRTLGVSNVVFLITTVLTSVTGFLFPFKVFGPPHIVGVISLVVLAIALFALYAGNLVGALALDLCLRRRAGALPQRLRRGGPVLRQDRPPSRAGTDRLGVALRHHPGRRVADIHRGGHRRLGAFQTADGVRRTIG